MATTINSYSVGFGMDASGYIDGAKISRSETRALIKDIEGARTPTEIYAREQDRLTKALESGAISEQTYARLLDAKRQKMDAANDSLKDHVPLMEKLSMAGNAVTGAYHAVAGAIATLQVPVQIVRDLWQEFDNVAEGLDDANDKAHKLGVTFNDIGGLTFAADRLGGADAAAALDKALGQMLKKGLVEEGESAADAFMRVADQVQRAATQSERAKIASDAFGKSGIELLAVLQSGSGEIGQMVDEWTRFSGLTESQIEAIGQYNDHWADISRRIDGLTGQVVAELAPALTLIAKDVLSMLDTFRASGISVSTLTDDLIVGSVMTKEMAEGMLRMASAVPLITSGQISAAGSLLAGIEDPVEKSRDALVSVYAERDRLQNEYLKKQKDADAQRNQIDDEWQKQETPLLADGAEALYEKHLAEKEQRQKVLDQEKMRALEQEEQRRNQMAKSALDAVKKEFDEREKRHRQLQADVAKGPGAGIEAGSAEAAKFLADQVNAELGAQAVPDLPTPGETELLAEAQRQLEAMKDQSEKMDLQIALLRQLAEKEPQIAKLR